MSGDIASVADAAGRRCSRVLTSLFLFEGLQCGCVIFLEFGVGCRFELVYDDVNCQWDFEPSTREFPALDQIEVWDECEIRVVSLAEAQHIEGQRVVGFERTNDGLSAEGTLRFENGACLVARTVFATEQETCEVRGHDLKSSTTARN